MGLISGANQPLFSKRSLYRKVVEEMKRILIALLLVITSVCLTFTACKKKAEEAVPSPAQEEAAPPAEEKTAGPPAEAPGPPAE
jgi:hypothetical protein